MTDRDVEREIEANEQRANDEARDDDGILDTAEDAINPISEAIGRADDDDNDAEASRRRLNDGDQRRGE